MHAAIGTAKPSTARRIRDAWLTVHDVQVSELKQRETATRAAELKQRETERRATLELLVMRALRSVPPDGISTAALRHIMHVRGADIAAVLDRLVSSGVVDRVIGARGAFLHRLRKDTQDTSQQSQSLTEKVDRVVHALQAQSATSIDEIAKRAGMKLVHGRKAVHHAIWEGRIINAGTARNPRYVVGENQR